MTTLAYQLYSSRDFPPLEETLTMVHAAGFRAVEGYDGLFENLQDLKKALNSAGLRMVSAHIGLERLEKDPASVRAIVEALDLQSVYVPFVAPDDRPKDAAGWRAFGQRLARAGAPLRDAGVIFGWHNHDFELQPLPGGELPLDLIAETEGVSLELDLGWVARAGHDPAAWIEKLAGRISAAHIKDLAPPATNAREDGWADVGHGIQDWKAITAALRAANVTTLVAEHDSPADHTRFATRSFQTMQRF